MLINCVMAVLKGGALILIVCGLSVYADDPRVSIIATDPAIDPVFNSIIQEKDKDVQLTCVVENKPKTTDVQWLVTSLRKNTTNLVQISTATRSYDAFRWAIDTPSPTAWRLRIQNMQVYDEGLYICQVQVVAQSYVKSFVEVRVVQIPQISDLDTSSDMTKNADEAARLECYATGRPTPLIVWRRLAGELLPNGGTEFLGSVLNVDRVQADHAGIYKCTASNSAGEDSREIRLVVNFRPEVYTSTPIVTQAVGYQKQLVCNVKGYPPPTGEQIVWTRESQPVMSNSRMEVRHIPGASNRITSIVDIWNVQREDFGRYRCSASNDKGAQYVTMEFQESSFPTGVKAGSPGLCLNFAAAAATIIMLVSVYLLQRL